MSNPDDTYNDEQGIHDERDELIEEFEDEE
jgi:hypothetical protein